MTETQTLGSAFDEAFGWDNVQQVYWMPATRTPPNDIEDRAIDRFAKLLLIDIDDPTCWLWAGSAHGSTPGFYDGGKMTSARRFAYRTWVGEIPAKAGIWTTCDNHWCVMPFHLEPVKGALRRNRS